MGKAIDLTGQRFGRLLVLEYAGKDKYGHSRWKVVCDCGREVTVTGNNLRSGQTKSCGANHQTIDLTGQRFGRLVVLEYAGKDKHRAFLWLCRCDCGEIKVVRASGLRTGHTKSCNCLHREKSKELATKNFTKHGHTRDRKHSPSFNSWQSMKSRCLDPNSISYPSYGALGVTVCDRWNPAKGGSFENFLADLGQRPIGTSLGRYGDVGPYQPDNCKFMTQAEQVANRRPDRKYGRKKTITEQIAA